MTKLLLSTVAALAFVGTASAADMAIKAPAPVIAPAFSWTGCYLGANVGAIIGADKLERYTVTTGVVTDSYSSSKSAATVGGQFGCQVQWSWFVLGGEIDGAYSGLNETYTPLSLGGTSYLSKDMGWFATARGKLGIAFGNVLLYGTGGAAWAKYDSNFASSILTPVSVGAYSENRIGYTVGGGLEYAVTANWSVKAEYLYLDFGTFSYRQTSAANVLENFAYNVGAKEHVARVGFNYSFRPVVAPVMAKY